MGQHEGRWGHRLGAPVGLAVLVLLVFCASSAAAASNTIFEWGDGIGSHADPNPVTLPGGVGASAISAGHQDALALGADGNIYAWGANTNDQLGNSASSGETPAQIDLPNGIEALSVSTADTHGVALGADGNVYAWGDNAYGQLGDGTENNRSIPEKIALPDGVQATAVSAGVLFTLALGADGKVYAWGYNGNSELGDGSTTTRYRPEEIALPGGARATAISAGNYFSLAIGTDGKLYAWGENDRGALGDGTTIQEATPEQITTLPDGVGVTAISAGNLSSLAVGSDGKLYAWGDNAEGELGDGTTIQEHTPEQITTLPSGVQATAVSASRDSYGGSFSLAAGSDGKVYAWGGNAGGQLGPAQSTSYDSVPEAVTLPDGTGPVQTVSAGAEESLVLVGTSAPKLEDATPPSTVTTGSEIYYQFTASGIPAPRYSLSADAPDWLSLDPATGVLSGTVPADASSFSFSVTAGNSAGLSTAGPFTVTIQAATAELSGTVLDEADAGVAGALVDACVSGGGACESATTGVDGTFTVDAPQGSTVTLTVYPPQGDPPQGDPVPPVETGATQVPARGLAGISIKLPSPAPPPVGVTFGAGLVGKEDGVPTLNWTHSTAVAASGCANGTASISVVGRNAFNGQWIFHQYPLTESPAGSGNYPGTLPPLYPIHGAIQITRSVSCPSEPGVTPEAGSTAGGNEVFLSGTGLTGTTGVTFGASPGTDVTVLDDHLLEVTAPPGSGTVTVTTTSASGPSVIVGQYTYISTDAAGARPLSAHTSRPSSAPDLVAGNAPEDAEVLGPLSASPFQDSVSASGILDKLYALAGPLLPNQVSLAIDAAVGAVHPDCGAGRKVMADTVLVAVTPEIDAAVIAATPVVEAGADIVFPEAIPVTAVLAPLAVTYTFNKLAESLVASAINAALGDCPGTEPNALVDPSGTVLDTNGNPLDGVTTTILRSDAQAGPFAAVDVSSPGIAPAINPETTTAGGVFHWDVSAGFYEVAATKSGCTAPGNPTHDTATIGPYPVPPPQVGLEITLQCPDEAPAPAPVVTGLSQSSGPADGGTQLDIYGSGFTPTSTVSFGSTAASAVTFLSDTELQVTSPAGAGLRDVTVNTAAGTSEVSSADQFYQGAPPTITAISAASGPTSGGTMLTITGTGFDGALAVGFPEAPGTQLTVKSDTELEVTTPAAASAGAVDIQVVNPAGASTPTAADQFTYESSSGSGSGSGGGGSGSGGGGGTTPGGGTTAAGSGGGTTPGGGTTAAGSGGGTTPGGGTTAAGGISPAVTAPRPGRAEITSRRVRLRHRRQIVIAMRCPRSASYCAGALTLTTEARLAGRRRTLPRQTFRISGGRSRTILVRLTRTQARLIANVHRLRLRARLTARVPGSATASSIVTLTLLRRR